MADVITITKVSALKGLKALVEEYGEDFVYQRNDVGDGLGCSYVHDNEPSCMIGKFLAAVGVPLERLALADRFGGSPAYALLESLKSEGVLSVEYGVGTLLNAAQRGQDAGATWKQAYDSAARYI